MLLWLAFLAGATLFPFEFQWTPVLDRAAAGIWQNRVPTLSEVVSNILLFVPAGALFGRASGRRCSPAHVAVLAGGAGLLVSLAIESLQLFLPRRDPTIVDVVANTAGAVSGALAARCWPLPAPRFDRWRSAAPARLLPGVLLALAAVALLMAGWLQRESRLSEWSPDYPLLAGNELSGDRPWRGRLFELELTDSASPLSDVRQFAGGTPYRLPGAVVARYDFSGGGPYRDASGSLPDLRWTGRVHGGHDGVALPGAVWLQTDRAAPAIANRLLAANAFSLRVQCASDDRDQRGPARIVSNSVDINHRNLMAGQLGDDLVVRIRTRHTGANGSKPEIIVPDVFASAARVDILITYDGATVLVAVAGSHRVYRVRTTPGAILARGLTSLDIEADEYGIVERLCLAVLFLAPAMLIAASRESRRERLSIGVCWVLAFAVLYEMTLAWSSGGELSWPAIVTAAAIGLAVVTVLAVTGASASGLESSFARRQPSV